MNLRKIHNMKKFIVFAKAQTFYDFLEKKFVRQKTKHSVDHKMVNLPNYHIQNTFLTVQNTLVNI